MSESTKHWFRLIILLLFLLAVLYCGLALYTVYQNPQILH